MDVPKDGVSWSLWLPGYCLGSPKSCGCMPLHGSVEERSLYRLNLRVKKGADMPKVRSINPKVLLLAFILVVITALMAVPALVISRHHLSFVVDELQLRAEGIAASTAIMMQDHAPAYRRLIEAPSFEDLDEEEVRFYHSMQGRLRQILTQTDADFMFTERWIDDETVAYVLDGSDPASGDFSELGDLDFMQPEERIAFLERKTLSTELITDPVWGDFVTAFSPIIDPVSNELLGLVGVDYSAGTAYRLNRSMNVIIAISFLSLILLTSLGIYVMFLLSYRISMEDFLTKLPSRRFHQKKLHDEILHGERNGTTFSLMMIDIDWFKQVNDTAGHAQGDRLLVAIAQVLRNHARSVDNCSRYGGDEFAIILPDFDWKKALATARKIKEAVSRIDAMENVKASLSIGIAQWERGVDEAAITECADQALYAAKAAGRGLIRVHGHPELTH